MSTASFCEVVILDMLERVRAAGEFLLLCVDGNGNWNLGVLSDNFFFPRPVDFGSDGDDDGGVGDAVLVERVRLAGESLLSSSAGVFDVVLFDDSLFPRSGDFDPFFLTRLGDSSLPLTLVLILQI